MSDAPQYPVGTIFEMAAIPEEAWPRFIAELPSILRHVSATALVAKILDGVAEIEARPPIWVDDGEQNRTIIVETDLGDEVFSIHSERKGGPA